MRNFVILLGLVSVFALVSCGGKKETKNEENKVVCEGTTDIAVSVQDYYYSMSDTLVFNSPKFEVKNSQYDWINDSTATLKLSNYDPKDLVGARTENQIDINIELNARNGKKLEPGVYKYHDYESGFWSRVTMTTAYGTVWFNWTMGMDESGSVTLEYADKDNICGTLSLNNEKPEDPMIGIVRINGTFVYKK